MGSRCTEWTESIEWRRSGCVNGAGKREEWVSSRADDGSECVDGAEDEVVDVDEAYAIGYRGALWPVAALRPENRVGESCGRIR